MVLPNTAPCSGNKQAPPQNARASTAQRNAMVERRTASSITEIARATPINAAGCGSLGSKT